MKWSRTRKVANPPSSALRAVSRSASRDRTLSAKTPNRNGRWRTTGSAQLEPVQAGGVFADDLVADAVREVAELALAVRPGVGPDAVGMGEVRAPHDLVGAEIVEQLDPDRVRLIRRPALAPPVVAGRHLERQVGELVLPLGVHP